MSTDEKDTEAQQPKPATSTWENRGLTPPITLPIPSAASEPESELEDGGAAA
jgi:hypothetical protein